MRRQIVSLALVGCLVYISMGFACSKATTLSWTKEVVSALSEAKPLLESIGLPGDKIATAISWGNKLVETLENPNSGGDVKQIAASLINAVEEVVSQTGVIPDGPRKTLILAFLGIANIALHHIADNVTETAAGRVAAGPVVLKFKTKAVWKCRDAKSGQYKKMEFCKANPDISVVETK